MTNPDAWRAWAEAAPESALRAFVQDPDSAELELPRRQLELHAAIDTVIHELAHRIKEATTCPPSA